MNIRTRQAFNVLFAILILGYFSWWDNWNWFQFFVAVDTSVIVSTLWRIEEKVS